MPVGFGYGASVAHDINLSGQIAGNLNRANAGAPDSSVGVVWGADLTIDAILASQTGSSSATSISNGQLVVGYDGPDAVLWPAFNQAPLILTTGKANGVNGNGMVVGNHLPTGSQTTQPFVYFDNTTYLLNSEATIEGIQTTLLTASSLNHSGQFAGESNHGGYLATPILSRVADGGSWSDPNFWSWGGTPNEIHPVMIDGVMMQGPSFIGRASEVQIGYSAPADLVLDGGHLEVASTSIGDGNVYLANGSSFLGTGLVTANGVLVQGVVDPNFVMSGAIEFDADIVQYEETAITRISIFSDEPAENDVISIRGIAALHGDLILDLSGFVGNSTNEPLRLIDWGALGGFFDQIFVVGIAPERLSLAYENDGFYLSVLPVPGVTEIEFGDGTPQRSGVEAMKIRFNNLVDFANDDPLGALNFFRKEDDQQVDLQVVIHESSGFTVLEVSFSGVLVREGGSLVDGNYQLEVDGASYSLRGTSLNGESFTFGNNENGDDKLFSFFGDSNGDRTVSLIDLFQFRDAFNGNYRREFDYQIDGVVGILDLFQFKLRFGGSQ